jgi:hypothetical protein
LKINFINVLRAAFERTDPESAKKADKSTVCYALSGSALLKSAGEKLVKLTPDGWVQ